MRQSGRKPKNVRVAQPKKPTREKPLSLYPLAFGDAVRGLAKVKPKKRKASKKK